MIPVRIRLLLALASPLVGASSADATWQTQGNPVCTAVGTQQQISACADGSGGVYVVWADSRASAPLVYAQHLFADGSIAPGWPVNGLPLTTSLLAQFPVALPDGAGGLLVIAQVGSNVVAQRVGPNGALAPGFPANGIVLTSDLTNKEFAAAPDGAGGAWVLRDGRADVNGVSRVRLTRVTRDGTFAAGWTVNGVTLVSGVYIFDSVHLEADVAGGAIVSLNYVSPSNSLDQGFFARVRANGTVAVTQGPVAYLSNGSPPGIQRATAVPDGRAGLLATWADWPNTGPSSWFGAHWDSTGTALWPAAMVLGPPYYPSPVHAVGDGSGGAYVIGASLASFDPYLYRFAADGSVPAGWSAAGIALGGIDAPENALLAMPGGVLAFWSTGLSGGNQFDLRALLVMPSGVAAPGWVMPGGNPICTQPGKRSSPLLIADGLGGAIACWLDQRDDATTGMDVYATRLVEGGPVATDASLIEASAEPDRVRLWWWSADGPRFAATLERESGDAGFTPIADLRADGSGTVRYEDDDVESGATYRYRLAVSDAGARRWVGEATVTIPGAPSFALEPIRPNPSSGRFTLAFTLPDTRPARIELVDLAGRRVSSEEIVPAHAGRFLLARELAGGPGVYVVRLTQGGTTRTTRLVHVR